MNVSIILFIAHQQHNMPQLLGRKVFRQFFHLPLTGLIFALAIISLLHHFMEKKIFVLCACISLNKSIIKAWRKTSVFSLDRFPVLHDIWAAQEHVLKGQNGSQRSTSPRWTMQSHGNSVHRRHTIISTSTNQLWCLSLACSMPSPLTRLIRKQLYLWICSHS